MPNNRYRLAGGLVALVLLFAGSLPPVGSASASSLGNGGGRARRRDSSERTRRVMLVDGRAVVRAGLCAVIEPEPDLAVVAEAATIRDAKDLDVRSDVIVTAVNLPDAKYCDAISSLRGFFQSTPILAFVPTCDAAEVESALAARADGYLLETASTDDVVNAIRTVADGKPYLHSAIAAHLAELHRPMSTGPSLSPLEQQVLQLLVLGHTNTEVARLCNMSLRTAESNRAQLQRKLGRRTRAELVAYALERGLIELGPTPASD